METPATVVHGTGSAAVVLVPSAFGIVDDVRAQMEDLASDARLVMAIDPYGDGVVVPYDDTPRVIARLQQVDREKVRADLEAAIAWARARDVRRVVAVGVCFGGPFVLRAAASGLVDSVVVWHGTRLERHLDAAPSVRCPMHLHFGAIDPVTPPAVIHEVRAAFVAHEEVRIFVHENATHGFTHRTAKAYDAAAERAAMDSVRAFARGA